MAYESPDYAQTFNEMLNTASPGTLIAGGTMTNMYGPIPMGMGDNNLHISNFPTGDATSG